MSEKIFCEGEVIIGWWSRKTESSAGTTDGFVKLYLPDDIVIDRIAALSESEMRGKKQSGGKLFYMRIYEYEDQSPQCFTDVEFDAPPTQVKLSGLAAIVARDDLFPAFGKQFYSAAMLNLINAGKWIMPSAEVKGEAEKERLYTNATTLIKYVCSIESRAQLDTSKASGELFNEMIYKPFSKFCKL